MAYYFKTRLTHQILKVTAGPYHARVRVVKDWQVAQRHILFDENHPVWIKFYSFEEAYQVLICQVTKDPLEPYNIVGCLELEVLESNLISTLRGLRIINFTYFPKFGIYCLFIAYYNYSPEGSNKSIVSNLGLNKYFATRPIPAPQSITLKFFEDPLILGKY